MKAFQEIVSLLSDGFADITLTQEHETTCKEALQELAKRIARTEEIYDGMDHVSDGDCFCRHCFFTKL
jgi:hypothetical protein